MTTEDTTFAEPALEPKPRSMRVRIQDMGREFRFADNTGFFASPFPSHSVLEKWWIEGFNHQTSR